MVEIQGNTEAFLYDLFVALDKAGLLSVLISRGLFTQALRIIEEYGCEGVDGMYQPFMTSSRKPFSSNIRELTSPRVFIPFMA